jgi:hypothetical protein
MSANTPVQVRLPQEELDALDSYRRNQLNPPSRGRALRELASAALRSSVSSHNDGEYERARGAARSR